MDFLVFFFLYTYIDSIFFYVKKHGHPTQSSTQVVFSPKIVSKYVDKIGQNHQNYFIPS